MKFKKILKLGLLGMAASVLFIIIGYISLVRIGTLPSPSDFWRLNNLIGRLLISKELFFLTVGKEDQSLEFLWEKAEVAIRHEFTINHNGNSYVLVSCLVHDGGIVNSVSSSTPFYLLFKDGKFEKILDKLPSNIEVYSYKNTTATRIKTWSIDDTSRIFQVLDSPSITSEEITEELKPYAGSKSMGNLPAVLITGYLGKTAQTTILDYQTNQKLLEQFDGCKVKLGMLVNDVDNLFGSPKNVFLIKAGGEVRLYGNDRELRMVNSSLLFSWVAVVFNGNGHAVAVYSNSFFCDAWKAISTTLSK